MSDDWFAPITDQVEYVNCLYWGREGVGKTIAALSVTKAVEGTVLVIKAEKGIKKKPARDAGVDLSRVVQWPPDDATKITRESYAEMGRKLRADIEANPKRWGAVILDSGSELYATVLGWAQRTRIISAKQRGADPDPDFIDRSDYGTANRIMGKLVKPLLSLPVHVIITAVERRDEDEDTHRVSYGPAFSPGYSDALMAACDIVLSMKGEDGKDPRRALTKGNLRYRAKDRYGVLPTTLVEPTFDRVLAYVHEDITAASDPLQASRTGKGSDTLPEKNDTTADKESTSNAQTE